MRSPDRKDKFWFCLKQVIRAEEVISHAGPTVKLGFTLLWGGKTKQVCAKFVAALIKSHQEISWGSAKAWGGRQRWVGGLLCHQRLQAPAAFTVCWWATALVAYFNLGSAGFCFFPMGLVFYSDRQDSILRDSAHFFVKSGPGNLSAETCCWLVCSGTLNSSITIGNALKSYCLPQVCRETSNTSTRLMQGA